MVIKKEQISEIDKIIKTFIININSIFESILQEKMHKKLKILEKKKYIYTSENILTLGILKDKLKKEEDLCINSDGMIEFFYRNLNREIQQAEEYVNILIKNKNSFEAMMKKKFSDDYRTLIKKNLSLLKDNIKSFIIYDYIIRLVILEYIPGTWSLLYEIYK